jgi:hypothetical protein
MSPFIYFICPEVQQYSKYCEAFFNYLTFGYRNWNSGYGYKSDTRKKNGRSRSLKNSNAPHIEEMLANDVVMDRIYEKVITSDCYLHHYQQLSDEEIEQGGQLVYITSNTKPTRIPKYLVNNFDISVWKVSNINKITSSKWNLFETLIRRMANEHGSN